MSSSQFSRRRFLLAGTGLAVVAGGGLGAYLIKRQIEKAERRREREERRARRVPPPSEQWVARVEEYHRHLAAGDFAAAALAAGWLTDEALTRADRVVSVWLPIRREPVMLLPREIEPGGEHDFWNYKDCAADLYCHLVIQAELFNHQHLDALRDMLARERALAEGLPIAVRLDTGRLLDQSVEERIFGAVEYVKDGLMPLLERAGETEWLERLHEVVDAIIADSPVESRHGRLPSPGTEKNGEMLQLLARLYHRERRPEHLAAGRAIADAYVNEVLPAGHGLPEMEWDFARGVEVDDDALELRDHANEIISGFVEWLIAESVAPDSRAETYRPAVEQMLDLLLERGRDRVGMWLDEVLAEGEEQPLPEDEPLNDNWGYIAAAYVAYALSRPEGDERRARYLAEAERTLQAALHYDRAPWRGGMDGYADSIEGALYLLPHIDNETTERWIDDQVGVLFAFQQEDGFVGRQYLDGNYVRTSLLYALHRTAGVRPEPWAPGVRLGAASAGDGWHFALASDTAWSGRLLFDTPRHRDILHLPFDYPRLNSWTEWFPIDTGARYEVETRVEGQEAATRTALGSELIAGLAVEASAGTPVHLRVRKVS